MTKKWLACVVLTAGLAASALAADVTGKWSGSISGRDGESFAMTFQFMQDGTKLTGIVRGPQGDPIEIADGKVEGDKVSFTINVNGGQMVVHHEGVVKGDRIEMTSKSDVFPEGKFTLKREK